MSTVHVWSCGQCGAPVRAIVGTIVQAFAAHAAQCPARRRPRPRRAATPRRAPRGGAAARPDRAPQDPS
jgi:hypothetical protein